MLDGNYTDMVDLYDDNVQQPYHLLSFLDHMNRDGKAWLEDVVSEFANFYIGRKEKGLSAEKKKCIFTRDSFAEKEVEKLILSIPFKNFEDMNFMHHTKHLGTIQIDRHIMKQLTKDDIKYLRKRCYSALEKYFKG